MKVIVGCDHAGFSLKSSLILFLQQINIEYLDIGCHSGEASVDYPDYAFRVASQISQQKFQRGLLCCGTGIGMSIAANRMPGVRCVVTSDIYSAMLSRQHNDSNILALGARVIGVGLAQEIVKVWLQTPFEEGRHTERINKIERMIGDE